MELVYLWVEDYKNIKKQGFNFSPKFTCKFHDEYEVDEDGKEKLKDNCKLEIKPKEYIKNFFGENINVTAIVGKNGSGKSTVIQFIRLFLKTFLNSKERKSYSNLALINQSLIIFYDDIENKFLSLNYKINYNVNMKNIEQLQFLKVSRDIDFLKKTIFPVLDFSLTTNIDLSSEKSNTQFINFPKKYYGINFGDEEKDTISKIFHNYQKLNQNNKWGIFENFFHPKYVSILLAPTLSNDDIKDYIEDLEKNKNKVDINFFKLLYPVIKEEQEATEKAFNIDSKHKRLLDLGKNKFLDIFTKLCDKNKSNAFSEFEHLKIDISTISKEEIEYLLELIKTDFLTITMIDKNQKIFNDLSFGEQQLLKVLNIIYNLATTNDTEKLIIFLDEVDLGFHPEWQKKVIKYILELIELLPEKEFHLLFSAHSPFIISDIPKQNIIFLDKDEKGNCKVVDGLKEKKQTFGANIHTLLSDSFFMEDGLMGEFAKGKIDKAIKLLNQDKLSEKDLKYCEQIISIIGEPIVKNQLQRMLDSKKINYIAKDVKEEIEFLKHRIDLLSKRL